MSSGKWRPFCLGLDVLISYLHESFIAHLAQHVFLILAGLKFSYLGLDAVSWRNLDTANYKVMLTEFAFTKDGHTQEWMLWTQNICRAKLQVIYSGNRHSRPKLGHKQIFSVEIILIPFIRFVSFLSVVRSFVSFNFFNLSFIFYFSPPLSLKPIHGLYCCIAETYLPLQNEIIFKHI